MQKAQRNQCNQCLFGPNRVVSAARMKEIIQTCKRSDTHFVCHKAPKGEDVVCAGFRANLPGTGQLLRIMGRMNAIEEVDIP